MAATVIDSLRRPIGTGIGTLALASNHTGQTEFLQFLPGSVWGRIPTSTGKGRDVVFHGMVWVGGYPKPPVTAVKARSPLALESL
jgi:hypothetical protein